MTPFERWENRLIWRGRGETLALEPWGPDSLYVRAALMRELEDTRWALLDPAPAPDVDIRIEEGRASIRCGRLTAVVEEDGWQRRGNWFHFWPCGYGNRRCSRCNRRCSYDLLG